MNRWFLGLTLLMALAALAVNPCFGQTGPTGQPAPFAGGTNYQSPISPYSNFFLGRNAAVNYYGGVAPLTQGYGGALANQRAMFPGQDTAIQRRLNLEGPDDYVPALPETGHPVRFGMYAPYYNLGNTNQRGNILYPFRQTQVKTK